MNFDDLQSLCELGQQQLMEMKYLDSERTLVRAEEIAWNQKDFDTLARLYMPLQETRRQRRQLCGEGTVCLDVIASGMNSTPDPEELAAKYPRGQLLVAGWASIEPALRLRAIQAERNQYAETLLAAVYPAGNERMIVIVPSENVSLPPASANSTDALQKLTADRCLLLPESQIPRGPRPGTPQTYAQVMDHWERLHRPFLAAADALGDPIARIEAYRQTIRVDYACELAHQKLSDLAKELARKQRAKQ